MTEQAVWGVGSARKPRAPSQKPVLSGLAVASDPIGFWEGVGPDFAVATPLLPVTDNVGRAKEKSSVNSHLAQNSDSQWVLKLLQKDGVHPACAHCRWACSVVRGPITTTIFLAVMRCLFPGTTIQTGVKIAEMSDKAKVTDMITFKKNSPVIFGSG